ncbi:MAG: hypothetical protein NTW72_15610 [Gemmatimonadetes bacterium]|nr:hypothetical protein [Gemmatimonadota bacterium]
MLHRFGSTWTGLTKFFPRRDGFVSLFSTSDATKEIFKLFACDSTESRVRCFAGDSPGRLLAVLPGDTLMILENPEKGSSVPKVGYYVGWR